MVLSNHVVSTKVDGDDPKVEMRDWCARLTMLRP